MHIPFHRINRQVSMVIMLLCAACHNGVAAEGPSIGRARPDKHYALTKDFSLDKNETGEIWSFRRQTDGPFAAWPLLSSHDRDANQLWGSEFEQPPQMWSDQHGYWGIGRNDTSEVLHSARNHARWPPGSLLLHPPGGEPSSGLALCWTAPIAMQIDVHISLSVAAAGGNGAGFRLQKHSRGAIQEILETPDIGRQIDNEIHGVMVLPGDIIALIVNTRGDPTGDIIMADVIVKGWTSQAATAGLLPPAGAKITAGSRYTFFTTGNGDKQLAWKKNGHLINGATGATYQLNSATPADAAEYSVGTDSFISTTAHLEVVEPLPLPERFASRTPRQVFAVTLPEQETQLETDELMVRFAQSRQRLAGDRYRPAYHFVSPESQLNDPNGLCFWQGRWHLFYQGYPPDEFPEPERIALRRQHWGHAVSTDLVHWRDLPYAIYPGIERMCFSGGTVVESDRVVAFYPGINAGQMVAVSHDPLLLNWEKLGSAPVHGSPTGDSCIWKEGDTYYGLIGADQLVASQDLRSWKVVGPFIEDNPFPMGDALACPGFVPIGERHLLVSFSHTTGGQYLLGNYDMARHRFRPYHQGRFNHGLVSPGGVHAPCVAADGTGAVVNILNINDGKFSPEWDQIMSLTQRLTLGPDETLRIAPVAAVANLRGSHVRIDETVLPANQDVVLHQVRGNTMELELEIDPREARWVQLNLLRSPDAREQTSLTFYNFDRKLSIWYHTPGILCLDGSHSSEGSDVWLRPPERTTLERTAGEPLKLRVFVDRSVVEVFANERRYLAMRVYPNREDSMGVSLRAQGNAAVLKHLDAWQMHSIWP